MPELLSRPLNPEGLVVAPRAGGFEARLPDVPDAYVHVAVEDREQEVCMNAGAWVRDGSDPEATKTDLRAGVVIKVGGVVTDSERGRLGGVAAGLAFCLAAVGGFDGLAMDPDVKFWLNPNKGYSRFDAGRFGVPEAARTYTAVEILSDGTVRSKGAWSNDDDGNKVGVGRPFVIEATTSPLDNDQKLRVALSIASTMLTFASSDAAGGS